MNNKCFSPLAGIKFAERAEWGVVDVAPEGFSPLAGIKFAESSKVSR